MIWRGLLLSGSALMPFAFPGLAAQIPEAGPGDSRVRYVTYDENDVTLVHVRRGQVTRIILDDDEKIIVAATGLTADCADTEGLWCIRADAGTNVIWIKPKDGAVRNNLELRTDRRDYSVELRVQSVPISKPGAPSASDPIMYRVIFRYPVKLPPLSTFMAATAASSRLDERSILEARIEGAQPQRRNRMYSMEVGKRSQEIVPKEAFDDGHFTYFSFSGRQEIPSIYAVDNSGEEARVNYHMDGDLVVVQRVSARFILRLGKMAVGVWNDGYGLNTTSLDHGTTVPGVERVIRGIANE